MPTEGLSTNLHPVALAVRELEDAQRRAANANDPNLAKQIGDTAGGLNSYLLDAARAEGPAPPGGGVLGQQPFERPMPVDPLEEARERLEAALGALQEAVLETRGTKADADRRRTLQAVRAASRAILAELDRRSPPTREGARTCVAVDDLSDQREAAWKGVRIGMDYRAAFDAGWIAARDAALAAAPPPPDVP